MEDFTSFCANLKKTPATSVKPVVLDSSANTPVVPNEYGGIYNRPQQPKIGFFKARLNRENFWNLIFWLGISLGTFISAFLYKADWSKCAFITTWFTILGVPYIVKVYSNITFTEDKNCLNHAGELLNNRCPNMFWFIVLNLAAITFIGNLLDRYAPNVSQEALLIIFVPIIFFLPVMWFILKNCPISILFYKKAWCLKITKTTGGTNHSSNTNWSTSLDPYYRHWGGNIHNRTFK